MSLCPVIQPLSQEEDDASLPTAMWYRAERAVFLGTADNGFGDVTCFGQWNATEMTRVTSEENFKKPLNASEPSSLAPMP